MEDDAAVANGGVAGTAAAPDAAPDAQPIAGPVVDAARCFSDGTPVDSVVPEATGACDAPFVVDLREGRQGDVFVHVARGDAFDADAPGIGKCGASTERDIVYNVMLPAETDLEISAKMGDAGDPIVSAQRAVRAKCDKPETTHCVDDSGAGACEYLRLPAGSAVFKDDTPQIIVSEMRDSGGELTLHLRLADPRGGS
jgi:hypothetical protein